MSSLPNDFPIGLSDQVREKDWVIIRYRGIRKEEGFVEEKIPFISRKGDVVQMEDRSICSRYGCGERRRNTGRDQIYIQITHWQSGMKKN